MESEGLQKLTEYLKQTRRQAEMAIDQLNVKIYQLEEENKNLKNNIYYLNKEKETIQELLDKEKNFNQTKWKFKERDEWKSLVDSIQIDRSRLQQENRDLTDKLDGLNSKIKELELRVEELSKIPATNLENDDFPLITPENPQIMSPVIDRRGNRIVSFEDNDNPLQIAMKLKHELNATIERMEKERKEADDLLKSKDEEISKLKDGTIIQRNKNNQRTPATNKPELSTSASSSSSWLTSWFGIFVVEEKPLSILKL